MRRKWASVFISEFIIMKFEKMKCLSSTFLLPDHQKSVRPEFLFNQHIKSLIMTRANGNEKERIQDSFKNLWRQEDWESMIMRKRDIMEMLRVCYGYVDEWSNSLDVGAEVQAGIVGLINFEETECSEAEEHSKGHFSELLIMDHVDFPNIYQLSSSLARIILSSSSFINPTWSLYITSQKMRSS